MLTQDCECDSVNNVTVIRDGLEGERRDRGAGGRVVGNGLSFSSGIGNEGIGAQFV